MSETHSQHESWWQHHTAAVRDADTVRADLFVRSLGVPVDTQTCQAAAVQQLDELESEGPITTTTVRIWGDRIYPEDPCAKTPAGRFILDKIEEMESWAEQINEVTLSFDRERTCSMLSEHQRQLIRLPCHCLSVYLDGTLSAVVPCSIDGTEYSLADYFELLANCSETTPPEQSVAADPARIQ